MSLKDPTHQYMSILEMAVSLLKECSHVQVHVDLPRESLPVWAKNRVEETIKAWSVQRYVVRQEACSFLKKTSGPSSSEGNIFFMPICNLRQLRKCARTLRTQNMVSFGQVDRSSENNASCFNIGNT